MTTVEKFSQPLHYTTLRISPHFSSTSLEEFKIKVKQDYTERGYDGDVEVFPHHLMSDLLIVKNIMTDIQPNNDDGYIIVDNLCGSAVLRGANIFAKGILCLSSCAVRGSEYDVFADLEGRCLRGAKSYTGERRFVGRGRLLVDRRDLFLTSANQISGIGVLMVKPVCIAPCLNSAALKDFHLFPQNLPSVVCGHVLEPKADEVVLDMCCAPGGKLTHIGQLMRDKGVLLGLEKSPRRAQQASQLVQSLKLQSVRVHKFDSCKAFDPKSSNHPECDPPPYPANSFHRVLLDAPCSGLGQRPSNGSPRSPMGLASYPPLQRTLLRTAVQLLRPGGTLVYSTCTNEPAENEDMVLWALGQFPHCLRLVPQSPNLRQFCLPPSAELDSGGPATMMVVQKFDPVCCVPPGGWEVDYDTIGFFIAKFVKVGPSDPIVE